jgi:hypothetical protein
MARKIRTMVNAGTCSKVNGKVNFKVNDSINNPPHSPLLDSLR